MTRSNSCVSASRSSRAWSSATRARRDTPCCVRTPRTASFVQVFASSPSPHRQQAFDLHFSSTDSARLNAPRLRRRRRPADEPSRSLSACVIGHDRTAVAVEHGCEPTLRPQSSLGCEEDRRSRTACAQIACTKGLLHHANAGAQRRGPLPAGSRCPFGCAARVGCSDGINSSRDTRVGWDFRQIRVGVRPNQWPQTFSCRRHATVLQSKGLQRLLERAYRLSSSLGVRHRDGRRCAESGRGRKLQP